MWLSAKCNLFKTSLGVLDLSNGILTFILDPDWKKRRPLACITRSWLEKKPRQLWPGLCTIQEDPSHSSVCLILESAHADDSTCSQIGKPISQDSAILESTAAVVLKELKHPVPNEFARFGDLELITLQPVVTLPTVTFSAIANLSLTVDLTSQEKSLDAIAQLPLRELRIKFDAQVSISSKRLHFLRSLTNLETLVLKPVDMRRSLTLECADDDFDSVFSTLSVLRTLAVYLTVHMSDPTSVFIDLARSCSRLERLRLHAPIDFARLGQIPSPLFPHLNFLWIASVEPSTTSKTNDEHQVEEPANALVQHGPKLEIFVASRSFSITTVNPDGYSERVRKKWRCIRRSKKTA